MFLEVPSLVLRYLLIETYKRIFSSEVSKERYRSWKSDFIYIYMRGGFSRGQRIIAKKGVGSDLLTKSRKKRQIVFGKLEFFCSIVGMWADNHRSSQKLKPKKLALFLLIWYFCRMFNLQLFSNISKFWG